MPVLEIGGQRVEVGDGFLKLSPREQQDYVNHIAGQIGQTSEPEARPDQSWLQTIGGGIAKGPAAGFDTLASIVDPVRGLQNIGHFIAPHMIPEPQIASLSGAAERAFPTPRDPAKRVAQGVIEGLTNPLTYTGGGTSLLSKATVGALGALGGEIAGLLSDDNRWARLFGGAIGGMAPRAAAKVRTPNVIPEERIEPKETLQKEFGIKARAGDVLGSYAIRRAEQLGDSLAGGQAYTKAKTGIEKQVSQAALREMGENAQIATPEIMEKAETRIGKVFKRTINILRLRYDKILGDDLSKLARKIRDDAIPDEDANVLIKAINLVNSNFITKGMKRPIGVMNGDAYHTLTQYNGTLGRLVRDPKANIAFYAAQIKDALDNQLERSAVGRLKIMPKPGDVAGKTKRQQELQAFVDFKEARRQWWNKLMIEKALASRSPDEALGLIQPKHLAAALSGGDRFSEYVKGKTRIDQLARAGEALISPRKESFWDRHGLMGVGALTTMLGHPHIGIPMMLAPGLTGRLANKKFMQDYFMNERMKNIILQMDTWKQAATRGALVSDPNRRALKFTVTPSTYGGTSE